MKNILKILMLEDDSEDVEIIEMYLKKASFNYEVCVASQKDEFVKALDDQKFDVILSDHRFPLFSSLEALQIRNQKKITTPFILVTGTISEEFAVSAIKEGASDYILKDRLMRLPTAIEQAIEKQKFQQKRIEAEQELLNSNERFQYASKATSDSIWDYNLKTGEVIWTEGFEKLFGYKIADLKPHIHSWSSCIHPEDKERVVKGFYKIINSEDQTSWSDQYRFIRANGTIANVLDKGIVLRDAKNNKPYRMVGAMQDITELVKSNEELKQFSFIISHNLYAPLSNLVAILNLVDHSTLDASNRELMQMLNSSTVQLKETIDDLSNILIIKNSPVDMQNVDIKKIIDKVKDILYQKINKVQPKILLDFEVSIIKSHRYYLESIFQNLLDNSMKFKMPLRPLYIKISTEKKLNGRTLITYEDNGCGIDIERHKKKLFGMYQRFHKNSDGKGLGLFVVKSQLNAIGGDIEVQSKPGVGTTFQITL